ncbi:MAG: SHOCT domain-containing protein [Mycobacterium sp.]
MMFWYDHNMGWWGYAGMGIGMVLVWVLIIVGIIALIRFSLGRPQDRQAPRGDAPTPEQLLSARFASGEIDETQYRERLAVLREGTRR